MANLERKSSPRKKANPFAVQAKEQQIAEQQPTKKRQDIEQKNVKATVEAHAKITALASMRTDSKVYELVTEAIEQYVSREVSEKDRSVFEFLVEKAMVKDK